MTKTVGAGAGMMEAASDEALMDLVARRDQRAFRVLMERHMARAIALAERIVGCNAEADDIAQETLVKIWEKASTFDAGKGRFTTWIYRMIVNLALDRRRRKGQFNGSIEDAEDIASNAPGPLAHLLAAEQDRTIEAALLALPERQKAAIALFHMEGLSGREAATIMSLSEKAFESLLIRARRTLRRHVDNEEVRGDDDEA